MMNLAEDVLGQILTIVIHVKLLVIQFKGLGEMLLLLIRIHYMQG